MNCLGPFSPWATRGMSLAEKLEFYSMPEPNSGCWLWLGHEQDGYGRLFYEGRVQLATRLSWRAYRELPPDDLFACHKCDNTFCINPGHLFLGTHQDNMDDMLAKGRWRPHLGEENGQSRLTEDDVRAILADGRTQQAIADQYRVVPSLISHIKNGHAWKHVQ